MDQWQPIETAPKTPDDLSETTCILAAVPNEFWKSDGTGGPRFDLYVVWWEPRPPYQCWCFADPDVQGFRIEPTHWQPLPEPPPAREAVALQSPG